MVCCLQLEKHSETWKPAEEDMVSIGVVTRSEIVKVSWSENASVLAPERMMVVETTVAPFVPGTDGCDALLCLAPVLVRTQAVLLSGRERFLLIWARDGVLKRGQDWSLWVLLAAGHVSSWREKRCSTWSGWMGCCPYLCRRV